MSRPNERRAAEYACRVLLRLGVDTFPIRPLDILHRCSDTCVMCFEDAAEALSLTTDELSRMCADADAMTIRVKEQGRNCYVVCYRGDGSRTRLNFTLAHELGHIILKHEGNSPAEEEEADCFASHLLCPRIAVEHVKDTEQLARLCYISRSAAEIAQKRKMLIICNALDTQLRGYIDQYLKLGARHPLRTTNDEE